MLNNNFFNADMHEIEDFYYRMFHFLKENTTDILWCVDLSTDVLYCFGNSIAQFHLQERMENFPVCVFEENIVYTEDRVQLQRIYCVIASHEKNHSDCFELRLVDSKNQIAWYACHYQVIQMGKKNAWIGIIRNINERKALEHSRIRDELTGCYNRKQTEYLISSFLKQEPANHQHLFLLIDLDQFKHLNDALGDFFGDNVLEGIGKQLRAVVRQDDIVGRIGGDEFIVFLKNINSTLAIQKKLAEIQKIFHYQFVGKHKTYPLSGSIGATIFATHGTSFEKLYHNADRALCQAKQQGGNQYHIYREDITEAHSPLVSSPVPKKLQMKIPGKQDVMMRAFKMIQHSKDLVATLPVILKAIGETLNVSRVSVFEYQHKTGLWSNSFEWCQQGVFSQREMFQAISMPFADGLLPLLTEDNIYVCNDTTHGTGVLHDLWLLGDIQAFMAGVYFYEGKPSFVLAVDECTAPRVWSDEDYKYVYFMTNLFAPYLSYETGEATPANIKYDYYRMKERLDFDALTGLHTKQRFFADTEKLLRQNPDKQFFGMTIDIVKFQMVNAYFGAEEGDRLLKTLADALKCHGQQYLGTYGRIGGDLFAGCFELVCDIETIAEYITQGLQGTIDDFRSEYKLRIVAGLYVIKDPNTTMDTIHSNTALAIKECKKNGNMNCCIYTDSLMQRELREQEIINDMYLALLEKQFEVYLQPKVSLSTGEVVGAEALCRWNHPVRGAISPAEFIPIFEAQGFITQLDYYIWRESCKVIQHQLAQGNAVPISVNVSVIDMHHKNIVTCFSDLLNDYDIPPQYLHVEVTESVCAINSDEIETVLDGLRALGLAIEMDDFGSGYSSLNMFDKFPIDVLKLDMLFLKDLVDNEKKKHIIQLIINLAKLYGITVVAEGIETEEQLCFLQNIGCHIGQGYLFSPPVSVATWNDRKQHSFLVQ